MAQVANTFVAALEGRSLYFVDTEAVRDLAPQLVVAQDVCAVCAIPRENSRPFASAEHYKSGFGFFQLVSSRYERASVIVTSNKPFGRWGEVFADDVVAAAMIDRLVHHAEVVSLKGDSYRLKDRDLGRVPPANSD